MEKVKFLNPKLNQAYEQAPWRRQLQGIGIFLLMVVAVALVAGINLNVTSRAATMGREIQDMTMGEYDRLDLVAQETDDEEEEIVPIEELKIQIADLEAQLAVLTSSEVMLERAEKAGFQKVDPEEILYIEIPGYGGRAEAMFAPPPAPLILSSPALPQAYRESLLDWFREEVSKSWLLRSPSDLILKGVQP